MPQPAPLAQLLRSTPSNRALAAWRTGRMSSTVARQRPGRPARNHRLSIVAVADDVLRVDPTLPAADPVPGYLRGHSAHLCVAQDHRLRCHAAVPGRGFGCPHDTFPAVALTSLPRSPGGDHGAVPAVQAI